MQDNKQPMFTPTKPEKRLVIEVSGREAHLIKELRKIDFGKVLIHKANGLLIRIEPNESVLITEDEGLDLSIDGKGQKTV